MTKWRIELSENQLMIYNDKIGEFDEAEFLYLHSNNQKAFDNAVLIPFDEIELTDSRTIDRRGYVNAKWIDCVQEIADD